MGAWWAGLEGTPGEIVWDADPADLEADLGYFAGSLDPALPMVDFGCGDGRQSRFLARRFPHVVGVDISAAAIRRACAADNPPNVAFQLLDARDPDGAARLHDELGDANVYIRGVLQALPPASRPAAVDTIAALLGAGTSRIRTVNSLPGGAVISVLAIWILSRQSRKS